MKKGLVLLTMLLLVFSLAILAGCGEKETTVKIGDEEITVTEDDLKELEDLADEFESEGWTAEDGNVSWEGEEPTEAELGAKIYPGAEYVPGTGVVAMDMSSGEGESSFVTGADYVTEDSFNKVVDFYTDKMGEPVSNDSGSASWIEMTADDMITVTATDDGGEVTISIGRISTK